ncbi:MAG: MerR family transcriptional regulator [Deltaproteobacteria bacterium]|nr:MerR family transcriptional regulator [Deltaproteobacteria bacterium]
MDIALQPLAQIGEIPPRPAGADLARLKIGDLAKASGRTVRALRLYEELGLLTPGERTQGGFRVYGPAAIERVRWIAKLQDLGFTLASIVELVGSAAAAEPGELAMKRVRGVFEGKLSDVREQMERLRALEGELVASLRYLEECSECSRGPVNLVCAHCEEPGHDPARTPPLVDGIRRRT